MKHFIVGPVEMYPSTKNIYQNNHPYFRTEEFGNVVKSNLERLSKLLDNPVENSLIYLTASGSAAMEAVVENCTNQNDKVIVINGGTFGQRFCQLLEHHNVEFDSINLKWNEALNENHLKPFENRGYTMMFVNLHETSTGQLYNIQMLSDFCQRNNLELVVDAISTFLADDYSMKKYGIDVTIISSQKGLCLSPGLSFVSMSNRMLDKIKRKDNVKSLYFDFKDYLNNITRGQTPYTPAVFIMYELEDILNLIENTGGKQKWLEQIKQKCIHFRKLIKEKGLKIPETYPLSNMLTPVYCENFSASEIVKHLREKYGLCVNPCGGDKAEFLFRVSHIGNTTLKDFEDLADKINLSTEEIKGVKNAGK